jgi:ribosome-associated protein
VSRKSRKGYYVDGEFVSAGSDADQRFRNELNDPDLPSRTELKNASARLQEIGEQLLEIRADRFAALPLPEQLSAAIVAAKHMSDFAALRRQKQFIGKLMRRLDPEALEAVEAALRAEHGHSAKDTRALHRAEQWRDSLIADDESLGRWIKEFPDTDSQQLRAMIRQARKDTREAQPGEALRQGRAYRRIFKLVRLQLTDSAET